MNTEEKEKNEIENTDLDSQNFENQNQNQNQNQVSNKTNELDTDEKPESDEQNDLVIGNAFANEDQFVDYSNPNQVNPLKKVEAESLSDDEIQQQIRKYEDWEKEYREKLKENLTFEKKGLFKERAYDADSNTFATYTKAIGGGYNSASMGSDASINQIKASFANVEPPVLSSAPKDPETLKKVVEAWTELKEDGFDMSKITVAMNVPKAYKEALKQLQKQDLVVSQELDNDNSLQVGKPINVPEPKNDEDENPKSEQLNETESQPENSSQSDAKPENEAVLDEINCFANGLNEKESNAYEEPPEFDDSVDFTNQETDFNAMPVQESAEKQQIDNDQIVVEQAVEEVQEQAIEQVQEEVLEIDHDAELLKELENDVDNAIEQQHKNNAQKQNRKSQNRQKR